VYDRKIVNPRDMIQGRERQFYSSSDKRKRGNIEFGNPAHTTWLLVGTAPSPSVVDAATTTLAFFFLSTSPPTLLQPLLSGPFPHLTVVVEWGSFSCYYVFLSYPNFHL